VLLPDSRLLGLRAASERAGHQQLEGYLADYGAPPQLFGSAAQELALAHGRFDYHVVHAYFPVEIVKQNIR
jgi:hypothetical protein